MKLVAVSKLVVTREQSDALLATTARVNAARSWLATQAMALPRYDRKSKYTLQRLFYAEMRERFVISAQMTIRAIATVAACFKTDPHAEHRFRELAAISYDARILSFGGEGVPTSVSIATLDGRINLPLVAGGPHHDRLAGDRGESDLVLRKGRWYLHTTVKVECDPTAEAIEFLGEDFGIVRIATDSDGESYCGADVEAVRQRLMKLRTALQECGTRSAKKHLKRLSGLDARFRADINHTIAKRIVEKAKCTGRGIALEDLTGIRDRVNVRKGQRAQHGSWAFFQLRAFVTYKAIMAGVPLAIVDPRNTSRACIMCGCCDKRNRRSQSEFVCQSCGFSANADFVAAVNIARRARVNAPIVSSDDAGNAAPLATRVQVELRRKPHAEA